MKHLILTLIMVSAMFSLSVEAKKNQKDMQGWLKENQWKSPKRTGITSIDRVYDRSDKLYGSIKAMADSLPVYSLRSIVENGDTVAILVVDQYNNPYNSLSAADQVVSGGLYLASVTNEAVNLSMEYVPLVKEVPDIVKSKGFAGIGIIKDVTSASKNVGKLVKDFLPWLTETYNLRGNPIKAYSKAQASMSPDDGFVKTGFDHVPEFSPDEMPTDAELDAALEQERSNRTAR